MLAAIRRWTPTLALALAIVYFATHALTGPSGLLAWAAAKRRIAVVEVELADARAVRAALEDRAARLREPTLDEDYLEERARTLLAMGHPRDVVVPAAALEPVSRDQSRETGSSSLD